MRLVCEGENESLLLMAHEKDLCHHIDLTRHLDTDVSPVAFELLTGHVMLLHQLVHSFSENSNPACHKNKKKITVHSLKYTCMYAIHNNFTVCDYTDFL